METESRQLAAVMFTDIVGYSVLTHKNEELSFQLLHEHRTLVRGILAEFRGREIGTTGDGFVVRFISAIDAVSCALAIQRRFSIRNAEVDVDRRIFLRIGVHIGDVLHSSESDEFGVFGDGVNIAARLQPLAPPGGICISSAVYEQIAGRVEGFIRPMGSPKLKGITRRIRLYSLEPEAPRRGVMLRRQIQQLFVQSRSWRTVCGLLLIVGAILAFVSHFAFRGNLEHRVAILPFDSAGFTEGDKFIPDGVVTEMIAELSRAGIHVLAKSSAITVKHRQMSPRQIGAELEIDRIVIGNLTKSRDAIKAQISIVDTRTQVVVASREIEFPATDVISLTKELIAVVADPLRDGSRQLASVSPNHGTLNTEPMIRKEAYLAYLKGQFLASQRTKKDFQAAKEHLERSVKLDPSFAPAHAELAILSSLETYYGHRAPVEGAISILKFANQALALDPRSPEALLVLAEEKAFVEQRYSEAERLYRASIASNPRYAMAHQWYAEFLVYRGRIGEALRETDLSRDLDPLGLVAAVAKGAIRYFARDYDEAITQFRNALRMDPDFMLAHYWLGRTLLQKKEFAVAIEELKKAAEISRSAPMTLAALALAHAAQNDSQSVMSVVTDVERISRDHYVSPYFLFKLELARGRESEALRMLERAVGERSFQVISAGVDPELDLIRRKPGFAEALARLETGRDAAD